jgi:hypothetical protein
MPTLTTPTVDENLWSSHRFWSRYRLPRGVTLLVSGTSVYAAQYPYQEDLEQYDHVYMGGRSYEITQAEADVLIAAGYGDYITP